MRTAIANLKSISAYSQSRNYERDIPLHEKERKDDYEKRTWRERCHSGQDGHLFIPPMSFKNALSEAAKYLSIQIPGKGKATFTKNFEAGVLVEEPLRLPVKKTEVKGEWLYLNSDGKRGGNKRVWRCMPLIPEWEGSVTFHILDDTITQEVFENVLDQCGKFIGIGRFRPRNNGFYGRFRVEKVKWS
jgi:hypothetical protein